MGLPRIRCRFDGRQGGPGSPGRRPGDRGHGPAAGTLAPMALRNDQGIVLRSYPFGEADRVVVLLSPNHGKVRAVAKGVRKTTSRFGGRLEPFTHVDLVLYEGRGLDTITQVAVIEAFPHLRGELERVLAAGTMVEVVDAVTQEGEGSARAFLLLYRGLHALESRAPAPRPGHGLPAQDGRRGGRGPGPGRMRRVRHPRGGDPVLLRRRRGAVRALPHAGGGGAAGRPHRLPGHPGRRRPGGPAGRRPLLQRRGHGGHPPLPGVPPRPPPRRAWPPPMADDLRPVPRHVAIILDGNGRWATARGLHRTAGHAAGEPALFDVVHGAIDLGIEWLTVYVFSTENWSRPAEEVAFLMQFNEDLLLRRRDELNDMGVRVIFMGDRADPRVSDRLRGHIADTEALTASNRTLTLVFAFNYGSRLEIAAAARRIAEKVAAGEIDPAAVDADTVAAHLYLPEMPDPDLVIRSSGEQRISNFLLWQSAYAEFAFPATLWPDFDRHALAACVDDYRRRQRRFGGVAEAIG